MFFYINSSQAYGGQERYLKDSINYLSKQAKVEFFGSPFEPTIKDLADIDERSVVVLNGNSALYNYIFKLPKKTFKVYVQHSNINDGQSAKWKTFVRKVLLKLLLIRVDLVVRVCENALPDFYAPRKTVTIYNGVDLPQRENKSDFSKSINLLMVGAINDNKNQKMALDALVILPDCRLKLVGSGPNVEALKVYANEIGVSDRVSWEGFQSDPNLYYKQSDILLMLSKYEAFPYVVLEAMAHSVPVVSVPVGGVPELIQHNQNGFLLEDYSVDKLVSQINSINIEDYFRIATSGRNTIENGYTIKHMMERFFAEVDKKYQHKLGTSIDENCC